MSNRLDRILAKITRAEQHIQDFQLGLTAFYNTNPYAAAFKEDANAGKRIYYVTKADDVPNPLAAIAADVIQNLRSPLDHVVTQFMIDGGATESALKHAEYPIRDLAAHYPSARGRIAKHVRKEAIDAIDATEPYKGGKGHALWRLNALNNPDKHHLLIGAGAYGVGMDIAVDFRRTFERMGFTDFPADWMVLLRDADPSPLYVGRELYIEPLHHEVNENRRFSSYVAFNEPRVFDGEPAIKTLQDSANLVRDIVTALGKLLAEN